jgi:predicted dehydrogenase
MSRPRSACDDAAITPARWQPMPTIDLRALQRMTDDTGLFQHAIYSVPDPNHGYCIDDNARALIAALLHSRLRGHDERTLPIHTYLAFLTYAFNEETGRFRNFMAYDRRWLEAAGSEDSQGRALWALGLASAMTSSADVAQLAEHLFVRAMPAAASFDAIRSRAFALLGLVPFAEAHPEHQQAVALRDYLAEALLEAYHAHATDDWPWWEDIVTYDNAKLSHALLRAGQAMQRRDMIEAGLTSLAWLVEVQTSDAGCLSIIGNDGWLHHDGRRAPFDQQPLEAYALVDACLDAATITADEAWAATAWWAFRWFHGENDLGKALHDPQTGGCQDGLQPNEPNKNQGAESVLAYLLSVLRLTEYREHCGPRSAIRESASVGLGIVGASRFAHFALDAYRPIENVKPLAVWSRTTENAERFASAENLRAHASLDDLISDPRVNLLYVATTPARHADQAIAALQAGKHVLCEKPLVTDPVDAQRMIEAARQRDRWLGVNFVMRYGPLAEPVRQLIASEALGAVLRGQFVNTAGDAGLPADHWFWDQRESGGIFIEHGVHFFDLFRAWLGQGQVIGAYRLPRPGTQQIDQAACDVRYGPQTTVNFYHGFHQAPANDQQEATLIFERGRLHLRGWVFSELTLHAALQEAQIEQVQTCLPEAQLETLRYFEDGATVDRRGRPERVDREVRLTWQATQDKQTLYAQAARALLSDGIEAMTHRWHRPRVTAEDGRAALELATQATRLAQQAGF